MGLKRLKFKDNNLNSATLYPPYLFIIYENEAVFFSMTIVIKGGKVNIFWFSAKNEIQHLFV